MRATTLPFICVLILLAAGAGRLVYLEHYEGPALAERARAQQTARLAIPALRGDILDTKGRLLAGGLRYPSVYADPALLKDPRDRHYAACSIAPVLGMPAGELEAMLQERVDDRFIWIRRGISEEEAAAFTAVRDARRLYAFGTQYEQERTHPYGTLAAHVLGFVGDPVAGVARGLAGSELQYDQALGGSEGYRVSTVDAQRRRLRTRVEEYVPPQDGASIVLTIDVHVQQQTELHLRNAVETFKARWGAAVVMDPQSGEILAMATMPDYDPAAPIPPGLSGAALERAQETLQNRAIAHAYEPGSVFKPFIAAMALEDGVTRLDEVFQINGPTRQFGRRTIHDTHAYSSLPLHEVISRSSNIGMSILGGRCGNDRLYRYVRSYGFGDLTGITLPGEHTGLVQDFSRWSGYSSQSIPIGQEIAVTGVQIAAAFSVFANGGVLYRPRIVRGVVDAEGNTILDCSRPVALRRLLSRETADRFREEALVETCMSSIGTGKNAQIEGYRTFGKTGTAQVAIPGERGYRSGQYVGSFVGGAPADNPRVVCLVSIYRPSSGKYYGGTVAAPAVGSILADTLAYMQVPPEVTSPNTGRIMPGGAP
ncbi:MAG: penicillin-binding protein 2 [Phycisphaerae bacterium]|jgi:cell division protein FtsI (penicillin-binding protein 3)